nr:MAG TPA: hypothetical protein [Caudoviricetes sp.]
MISVHLQISELKNSAFNYVLTNDFSVLTSLSKICSIT